MRVDKLIMLGVGALGLYAVYRIVTNPPSSALPPAGVAPHPQVPQVINLLGLPELPGPIPPPTGQDVKTGDVFDVENNRWYRGRIETLPAGGAFASALTREQIQAKLASLGFDHVLVDMDPNEAMVDIPVPFALANPGKGTRWFWARWSQPTTKLSRPQGMVLFWTSSPQKPVVSSIAGNFIFGDEDNCTVRSLHT